MRERLDEHRRYVAKYGEDMPEIVNWRWGGRASRAGDEVRRDTGADF